MLAGYHSRPLVSANFGAALSTDLLSQRSFDDWQTTYDGAARLAEYLNYIGYSGDMLTVMADGGTIYPSQLLEANSQYDSGLLLGIRQRSRAKGRAGANACEYSTARG